MKINCNYNDNYANYNVNDTNYNVNDTNYYYVLICMLS
jgi:hypothetical protein